VRLPQATSEHVIRSLKRQAPTFAIAAAAALLAAGAATADPSVASKQAQARQVLAEIQQVDSSMERAVEQYNAATVRLQSTQRELRWNRAALKVAKANLSTAQKMLAQRLVSLYTQGDDANTLAVLLGATNLDDLISRLETVHSVTRQDTLVLQEVTTAKTQIVRHQRKLEHARTVQQQAVAARAAEKARIRSQLAQRRALLASIKSEIARIQAREHARQLALATQARARYDAAPPADPSGVGVAVSTPDATVAPPSQYGGVVGIAMRYLGVPYVWGGASPSGFDCSGLVAYAYGQMGVSLPHYTGAQWNVGVAVSRDSLEPGDLVFFDGLNHVGIYIGGGQFIHAPHTGDVVKISSLSESWYASTYVGARRVTG
jgi:peptidoglycan DL-endopeptidase CwlO